jgi:hypothetical protein
MNPITIVNPLEYPNWDELLLTNDQSTFFHTSAWARVLSESYNYKPLYFTSIDNGKISALIPVMEVNSFITGKRGVSLPFTDYCQPIVPDTNHSLSIIDEISRYGKKAGWRYIEIRGDSHLFKGKTPSVSYFGHTVDLTSDEKKMLGKFRSSTKRNIKKAIKEGVKVEVCHSLESVRKFYRLNCITRKRHGLPPQPYIFFKKVHEHIISKKKGVVVLASHLKKTIAGAVYFHFGRKALFKYGASNTGYLHLRPNNLVMWEAIKWYAQNGFRVFGFGRTESENEGLLQFKRGWGVKEEPINYFKYDLTKNIFIKDRPTSKMSYRICKMLPLPLLNLTGSLLYKHVG